MELKMTHREYLEFANGVAECKTAITSGVITSNKMFSFYIDTLVNKLKDSVITLHKHLNEVKPIEGESEYKEYIEQIKQTNAKLSQEDFDS